MHQVVRHSATPAPISALLSPGHMVGALWQHRGLIRQFAARYFQARFRGTYLGILWALLLPLLMLAVFTFVFNFVMGARFGQDPTQTRSQYAVLLFCGITVYSIFSETVVRSCGLVLDNPNYVKKVVFPLETLPVASLLSSLMFSAFGLGLVIIGTAIFYHRVPWTIVLLPLVLAPALALGLGIAWFLSSLAVFIRDIGNLVTVLVTQLLFFLTPIFYTVDNLPEGIRWVVRINPLAAVVEGARRVMILGEQPDWTSLLIVMGVGLVCMQFGYAWFVKSKRGFADVL